MGFLVLFAPFVIKKEQAGLDWIPTLDWNTRKFITDRVQYAKFSRPVIKGHIESITKGASQIRVKVRENPELIIHKEVFVDRLPSRL